MIADDGITLLDRESLITISRIEAPGVDAIGVSEGWLVYRARREGRDVMFYRSLADARSPGPETAITSVPDPFQLGRPGLDGNLVVFAVAKRRVNRIVKYGLDTRKGRTLLSSRNDALSNPAVRRGDKVTKLAYVRASGKRQRLMVKRLGAKGHGHSAYSRKGRNSVLWSTAFAADRLYLTLLQPGQDKIVSIAR